MLRRDELTLEGNMCATNPVMLLLRLPDPNGKYKNIEFQFDLEKDTSFSVSSEMIQELELPPWCTPVIIAKLIDGFLLKTVRGWRPCVQIGQMIQVVHKHITASVNGK